MSTRPYRGAIMMIKTQGAAVGAMTVGAQRNILCVSAMPRVSRNIAYPGSINRTNFLANRVRGKRRASGVLMAEMKPYIPGSPALGWCDADFLNSCLSLSAATNTDRFSFGFKDDGSQIRVWDWARVSEIYMSQDGNGGPVNVRISFLSRWGAIRDASTGLYVNQCPYGTSLPSGEAVPAAQTFTVPTGSDYGDLTGTVDTAFTGINQVTSWELTMRRGQSNRTAIDGDYAPFEIASTMFDATLTVTQEADAPTFIGDSGTIAIQFNTGQSSTTGRFTITLAVSVDQDQYDLTTGFGSSPTTFTAVNLAGGGSPVTIAAT